MDKILCSQYYAKAPLQMISWIVKIKENGVKMKDAIEYLETSAGTGTGIEKTILKPDLPKTKGNCSKTKSLFLYDITPALYTIVF